MTSWPRYMGVKSKIQGPSFGHRLWAKQSAAPTPTQAPADGRLKWMHIDPATRVDPAKEESHGCRALWALNFENGRLGGASAHEQYVHGKANPKVFELNPRTNQINHARPQTTGAAAGSRRDDILPPRRQGSAGHRRQESEPDCWALHTKPNTSKPVGEATSPDQPALSHTGGLPRYHNKEAVPIYPGSVPRFPLQARAFGKTIMPTAHRKLCDETRFAEDTKKPPNSADTSALLWYNRSPSRAADSCSLPMDKQESFMENRPYFPKGQPASVRNNGQFGRCRSKQGRFQDIHALQESKVQDLRMMGACVGGVIDGGFNF